MTNRANAVRWAREAERRGPEAPGGKICVTCEGWKPFAEYWKHSGGRFGLRPQCKSCIRSGQHLWRRTEGGKAHAKKKRVGNYGLTPAQYDAMLAKQSGVCAICGRAPRGSLVIDHDHSDGTVRGLLCRRCNIGIANFDERPDVLIAARNYLRPVIRDNAGEWVPSHV